MKIRFIAADGHCTEIAGNIEVIARAYRRNIGHTDDLVSADGLVRAELHHCTIEDINAAIPRHVLTYCYPDIPGNQARMEREIAENAQCEVSRMSTRTLSGHPMIEVYYVPKTGDSP